MPIPPFTIDGVLPPFTGATPALSSNASPYRCEPSEVASQLGTTAARRQILRGWIAHRQALLNLGFQGFQWLDGSFLELKDPNDLDLMIFVRRPPAVTDAALMAMTQANPNLFDHAAIKAAFTLDAFFLDLNGDSANLAQLTAYFFGLFSHQRVTFIWKGMLQVELNAATNDALALQVLDQLDLAGGP